MSLQLSGLRTWDSEAYLVRSELSCCSFHPDGHLFAVAGENGDINIFQTASGASAASFPAGGPVQALAFSENGTWLAVAVRDSPTVSVWDLRKGNVAHSLDYGGKVDSIEWDYTGQFLAGAGSGGVTVKSYDKAAKSWAEPLRRAASIAVVRWAPAAKGLIALTSDGSVGVMR